MSSIAAFAVAVLGMGAVATLTAAPVSASSTTVDTGAAQEYLTDANATGNSDNLAGIIGTIINFVLGVIGLLCVVIIIIGGVTYATSQGDAGKVSKATKTLLYGVVGLVVAFALLMAATGILASAPAVLYYALPEIDWSLLGTAPVSVIGLSVCVLLVVGIPIWGFLQLLLQSFNVWHPMSTGVKITLILLWILAVAVGTFFLFQLPFLIDSMYWA